MCTGTRRLPPLPLPLLRSGCFASHGISQLSTTALQMVEGLGVTTDKKAAAEQIKGLYHLFVEKDCTMGEV